MGKKYTHMIVAEKLEEFKQLQEMCLDTSERTLAELLNIPRTTLQHWQERQNNIDEDPDVVAFFTSPARRCLLAPSSHSRSFCHVISGALRCAAGVRVSRIERYIQFHSQLIRYSTCSESGDGSGNNCF